MTLNGFRGDKYPKEGDLTYIYPRIVQIVHFVIGCSAGQVGFDSNALESGCPQIILCCSSYVFYGYFAGKGDA